MARERIPTLDGWRGIAILLVLVDHLQCGLYGHYLSTSSQTGAHGVTIFFVLSGFLITSKLIERESNLKAFYLRRFFRLMPAAWAYLAFLSVLHFGAKWHVISCGSLVACVLFFRNFTSQPDFTLHYWSLSLEEQFYLLWPCVLLLAGARRCRWLALLGAVACASYRWFNWDFYNRMILDYRSQVRADALLIGCVLALFLKEDSFRVQAKRWSRITWAPALAVLIFCMANFPWLPPLSECIAIAILICATSLNSTNPLARPFSFASLAWLGTVSYSAYIWQQFFIGGTWPSGAYLLLAGCFFPICVLLSYYCVERPCVRFAHRITSQRRVDSPTHAAIYG